MEYYGFSFKDRDCGGLGAMLHDVLMASKYAEENNLSLCFVQDGYEIPRLNGSLTDDTLPDHCWHTFFNSFPIVDRMNCKEMWPCFLKNRKLINEKWSKQKFHQVLTKICDFHPHIHDQIQGLVDKTPFNENTDVVLHIRQTDKLIEVSKFVELDVYIKECEVAFVNHPYLKRIYICTDDQFVCGYISDYFKEKQVEVVWDKNESILPLHTFRIKHQLTKLDAQHETFNAFKNLFIMKKAKYLIGARMSYFFRIGELLGYPNPSVNLQDNEKFGPAPYAENEKAKPLLPKNILNFINPNLKLDKYIEDYKNTGIVSIPSFINNEHHAELKKKVNDFAWWTYASHTNDMKMENELVAARKEQCSHYLEQKLFSYRFQRSHGSHYDTCICAYCKLSHTFKSFPVMDTLCKVIGCNELTPNEMFLSKYSKDDFLSVHHDIKKGDISVTCSLTDDWNVAWGGILHFCNETGIYKSISPSIGTLNIFKLDPNNGLEHFVSMVSVNKTRHTFTAWYTIVS
jgi:hypothetical protein